MSLSVEVHKRLSPAFGLDVSFQAPAGITIVFGASGSGKTTLLRMVAGLLTPDSGRLAVADRVLFDSSLGLDVPVERRQIGYVFQHLALFPHLTVADNIQYGLAGLAFEARRERTGAIAGSFRISHLLERRPGAISGGERQRVALARALVTNPSVLLLDEPLAALDHYTQSHIIEDLKSWNDARAIPILYVTHAHREVFALGERVIVLDAGRLAAAGTPDEVLNRPDQEQLAQIAGFENIFTASVLGTRPDIGTSHCRLEDSQTELEIPLIARPPGHRLRIAIRAGDILLATQEPIGLSARNILPGRVAFLRREATTMTAGVDAGVRFLVHLTPGGAESLRLHAGDAVWLIVKTHSCRIVSA